MLDYGCAALCHIKVIRELVCYLVNDKRIFFFLIYKKKKKSKQQTKALFHVSPVSLDSLLKHCLLKVKYNSARNEHFMHIIIIFIFIFSYSYSITQCGK